MYRLQQKRYVARELPLQTILRCPRSEKVQKGDFCVEGGGNFVFLKNFWKNIWKLLKKFTTFAVYYYTNTLRQ